MKQLPATLTGLRRYLPKSGKRLIELIGWEAAFRIMQVAGGKTYLNCTTVNGILFKICFDVFGDMEAHRITKLLSDEWGRYVYIPSLKSAISAQKKALTCREIAAQYSARVAAGKGRIETINALAMQFDASTTTIKRIIKGVNNETRE